MIDKKRLIAAFDNGHATFRWIAENVLYVQDRFVKEDSKLVMLNINDTVTVYDSDMNITYFNYAVDDLCRALPRKRFEDELMDHGNMTIEWIADEVALVQDTLSHSNRTIAVLDQAGKIRFYEPSTFKLVNSYESIDEYVNEEDFIITLNDIELCVNVDEKDEDGSININELKDMCDKTSVQMKHVGTCEDNGWPTFTFKGTEIGIRRLFIDFLGYSIEDVDDMISEAK